MVKNLPKEDPLAKKKPDKLDELLDQLTGNSTAAEILKDGSLLKELQKRFIERALEAETTDHLGYENTLSRWREHGLLPQRSGS